MVTEEDPPGFYAEVTVRVEDGVSDETWDRLADALHAYEGKVCDASLGSSIHLGSTDLTMQMYVRALNLESAVQAAYLAAMKAVMLAFPDWLGWRRNASIMVRPNTEDWEPA